MTIESFFEKFNLLAETPNAVAKLREIVLQLAVDGKLVESGEEWTEKPLRMLTTKIGSGSTPTGGRESYVFEGIPLIRSMNVYFSGFRTHGLAFLTDEQAKALSNVIVQPADVLLNITGASIGRVTIAPTEMAGARVNQHVAIIRPTSELLPEFLAIFLASPAVQLMIDEVQVGATRQALTKAMIEQFEIPLPPPAEQKRIVAKVDELMALCDRLEAQQKERETKHAALAQASLSRFAKNPTPANLDFLFHSSFEIPAADLGKAILSLAVRGNLVSRDSREGDAGSDLRAAGVRTSVSTVPPSLPRHWAWVELGDVSTRMDSGWSPACLEAPARPGAWGVLKTTAVQTLYYQEEQNKELPPNLKPRPEHQVEQGDVLFTRAGPMNRVGIVCVARPTRRLLMLSDKIIRFHLIPSLDPDFVALALNAGRSREVIETLKSGMAASQVNISQPKLRSVPLPIPPLGEQLRIVAKVRELFLIVNRLEALYCRRDGSAHRLLESIVGEISKAA